MKTVRLLGFAFACTACLPTFAHALTADLSAYRAQPGLTAAQEGERLVVAWTGTGGLPMRMQLGLDGGTPSIHAIEYQRGPAWTKLSGPLKPQFSVVTGMRRSENAYADSGRWDAYWDAPLTIPGNIARNRYMPRRPEEIGRANAIFNATGCQVKTDGARLEITFPGVQLGIFAGDLRMTVYRGTNLFRQEIVAKTESPWVAYIYQGGLSGFSLDDFTAVEWRDVNHQPQRDDFAGAPDEAPVPLRARNRVAVAGGPRGSVAVLPPPHVFFFARQLEINLGFVWQQKQTDRSFALGVRQNERHEGYRNDWNQQVWPLYNAPPGTLQRMSAYFYFSPEAPERAREEVMAFTHGDRYKPLPGYKTMATHFHTAFTMDVMAANNLDQRSPWNQPMRDLGLNIVYLCDFHGSNDGHPNDLGPVRFKELQTYFEASRRQSDEDFLIVPGEEPNAYLGGHYNILFPKPVYWTLRREPGAPFTEEVPGYGRVYRTGSAADVLEMLKREDALVWQTHPRGKASTGWPDLIKDTDYFKSDRYLGGGFKALPVDLSQQRLGEVRCFGLLDDMNNWGAPKYLVGEVDTYKKYPEYDLYGDFNVNYLKLDRVPAPGDFAPIVRALRTGDFFVSTGEVLIPNFTVKKIGAEVEVSADLEWTFPLEFIEVVWGDGEKTDRRIVRATDRPPFGAEKFTLRLPAAGKKWVRLSAWDSAVNGGFTQPVHLADL